MGEYVNHIKAGVTKLGTCENLYYTTFERLISEMPYCQQQDGNALPVEYLNPENGFRYRFPFPDENHIEEFGRYPNYDRGYVISIPRSLFDKGAIEIVHGQFHIRTDHPTGYSFGYNIPCPADEYADVKINDWHNLKGNLILEIVQQKLVDYELMTVARCPFCGDKCLLSREEIDLMHRIIHDDENAFCDLTKQIIDIARAGYTLFQESE